VYSISFSNTPENRLTSGTLLISNIKEDKNFIKNKQSLDLQLLMAESDKQK